MSINKIALNNVLVADLYKNVLIADTDKKEKKSQDSLSTVLESDVKFLGNNKKNILILVAYNNYLHLPDNDLTFLGNILTACKLSLDDVAIVNKNNCTTFTYKEFVEKLNAEKILLIGIEPVTLDLPISFPQFQIQAFSNVSYLSAPTLSEIEKDKKIKVSFWNALKRLFDI